MRAYLLGYQHGQTDGYHSTLIEQKMMDESYDAKLNVEYIPIDRILEIIDEMERDTSYVVVVVDGKANGVLCNSRDVRDRILALKGGDKE